MRAAATFPERADHFGFVVAQAVQQGECIFWQFHADAFTAGGEGEYAAGCRYLLDNLGGRHISTIFVRTPTLSPLVASVTTATVRSGSGLSSLFATVTDAGTGSSYPDRIRVSTP